MTTPSPSCGCKIIEIRRSARFKDGLAKIEYCPTHAQAFALREILKKEHESVVDDYIGGWDGDIHKNCEVCKLLSLSEPKEDHQAGHLYILDEARPFPFCPKCQCPSFSKNGCLRWQCGYQLPNKGGL